MTRRAFLRLAVALTAASLAAACGALPTPSGPTPASRPTTTRDRSQATSAPRDGGTATVALASAPESLDPANGLSLVAEQAGRPLHDGLLELGPKLEPKAALAERWTISPDGLIYTFALRRGVSFHDDTPFDARTAQYNLERFLGDERPRRAGLLAGLVRSVRATGDFSLELRLDRPFAPLLQHLAQYGAAMVSPAAHRVGPRTLGRQPVGTGPFRFVSLAGDGTLTLERFEGCWRGPARLDGIVFKPVGDEPDRLARLTDHQAQLGGILSLDLLDRIHADDDLAADLVPTTRALGVSINTTTPPFGDKRVRQALNFAVDKQALVQTVFGGEALPLGGPVAPSVHGGVPLVPYPFDLDRARRLLDEAAFPWGLEFALLAPRDRFWRDEALAREVARQLQAAGLKIRLDLQDSIQYIAALTRAPDESPPPLALVEWHPWSGEARAALYPLFHSSEWMPRGQNASLYKSPVVDDLLDRASGAADLAERDRLFRQAQEVLHDEAPWIFLVSPKALAARSADLHEPLELPTEIVTVSEKTWVDG